MGRTNHFTLCALNFVFVTQVVRTRQAMPSRTRQDRHDDRRVFGCFRTPEGGFRLLPCTADRAGGVKLISYWLRSSPHCCKLEGTRGHVCCQCVDDRAGGINLISYWLRSSPPCYNLNRTRGCVFCRLPAACVAVPLGRGGLVLRLILASFLAR